MKFLSDERDNLGISTIFAVFADEDVMLEAGGAEEVVNLLQLQMILSDNDKTDSPADRLSSGWRGFQLHFVSFQNSLLTNFEAKTVEPLEELGFL